MGSESCSLLESVFNSARSGSFLDLSSTFKDGQTVTVTYIIFPHTHFFLFLSQQMAATVRAQSLNIIAYYRYFYCLGDIPTTYPPLFFKRGVD